MTEVPVYVHPPGDRLDYTFDFAPLLDEGETISAHAVTGQLCTVTGVEANASKVTCWAEEPVGTVALLSFTVTTSLGREHTRTVQLDVRVA